MIVLHASRPNVVEKIIDRLSRKSAVTTVQLETLLLQKRVKIREIRVADAARLRKPARVSPGSYYRVLDQARSNFERAIFTLLLGVKLDVIQVEGITRLLSMVKEVPDEMVDESLEEFVSVMAALIKRIVMI
jgi:hypothetical protein